MVSFASFSCEFLFVSLLAFFNLFPQIYYFTSPQGFRDHCAHLRDIELKTGRKIPYLSFPMYYSLYNWIGEHEITKLKNIYIYLLRIQKKDTKASTKRHEGNAMTQNGLPVVNIFSNVHA